MVQQSEWNKNISILLSGQMISQVGDKFYILALSYWVLETFGSPAIMGMVLACSLFPSLVFGFISGAFIDKYDRKRIIIFTDVIRGCVITLVTLAYFSNSLTIGMIMVAQVALSICAAFFDPAIPAIIPQIVSKDQLTRANSKTQFISGFSSIAGPILGGIAVAALGYTFVFVFNAASFFISGIFESFMKIPKTDRSTNDDTTISQDILEGYRYIVFDKKLVIILLMVSLIHFFVGSIEVVIPVLAVDLAGNGAENLGFIQASIGLGAVIMAFLISIYSIDQMEVGLLFGSVFCIGFGYIIVSICGGFGIKYVLPYFFIFLFIGALIILAGTCFKSMIQKSVENQKAGRVFGVVGSVGNGSIPLAMLIYGILLTHIQINVLLLVSGMVLLPVSIVGYYIYKKVGHARHYQSGTGTNRYKAGKEIVEST